MMKNYAQFLVDKNLEQQCVEDTWIKNHKLTSEKCIAARDARSKSIISAKDERDSLQLCLKKLQSVFEALDSKRLQYEADQRNAGIESRIYETSIQENVQKMSNLEKNIKDLLESQVKFKNEKMKMETDLKNIWNAHLKVLLNYKVNMHCHIDLVDMESNTFILSFFQEVKRADPDFFIKLSYKTPDEWTLLDLKPMLPDYDSLCTKLHQSRDILRFLSYVYEEFTALK
ncbi:unnamed protein product [Timema podura]|uniref:Kinetochore protein SPC25 n=1 Tax=Timema podura TaxID=61482 RepID=A0ABN7NJ01_TIMPD|nr:unnamed protein product [Timema podura]